LKLGYLFFVAFLISLGVVVFGEAGLLTAFRQSQDNALLENRVTNLQRENDRLLSDIDAIQKNSKRLELVIRSNLSLVAPDEILFEFQ